MSSEDKSRIAASINLPRRLISYELEKLEKAGQINTLEYKTLYTQQHQLYKIQQEILTE